MTGDVKYVRYKITHLLQAGVKSAQKRSKARARPNSSRLTLNV